MACIIADHLYIFWNYLFTSCEQAHEFHHFSKVGNFDFAHHKAICGLVFPNSIAA
jgi:hypothetical protein